MKELGKPRGRKPADSRDAEIAGLKRRAERAEAELAKMKNVVEIQGNVSALLEQMLDRERAEEHRAMIADSRGTHADHRHQARVPGGGCVSGDDLPSPPAARAQNARLRPTPARALTAPERQEVLDVLHSERFVDVSPEETYATLLDEGTYLCSTRTMYRVLAAHHGGVRERRAQLTHPPTPSPSCSPHGRTSCGPGT